MKSARLIQFQQLEKYVARILFIFFTDAVQAAAHIKINVMQENVDCLSLGAHKCYGPKGVGALYVREGIKLTSVITDGNQEFGMRPGIQNLPLIWGMAKAMEITVNENEHWKEKMRYCRNYLIREVLEFIPQSKLTGHPNSRLPNHESFAFNNADGNKLVMILDSMGFACSLGSACKSGDAIQSVVLKELGMDSNYNKGSLRVTLGRTTTIEEIRQLVKILPEAVKMAEFS